MNHARTRIPSWASDLANVALTSAIRRLERRRATRLRNLHPLRLHLGSADNRLPGWINIDLMRPGRRLDLYWDLRRGIPFPDGSVDAVFAEHLLEHLDLSAGISLLRKCRRVLRPGAQVRIGVPDLDRYLASYLGQDDLIERVRAGRPTRAVALGEVFFLHGHRSMSDFETLSWAFREAGFAHIERFEFGVGRTGPAPDSERRRTETLYVEGWFDAPEPETSA